MLTKEDLLKLSKERLAELLLEEWSKMESLKTFDISVPKDVYDGGRDLFSGRPGTTPCHDFINYPTTISGDDTTISTVRKESKTIKQASNV